MKVSQLLQPQNGFDTERVREKLLAQKKYKQLLATYFQKLPEIVDSNSPEFWDEKFENETDAELFYMTTDRNDIIASLIQKNRTNNTYAILNVGAGSGQLEKAVTEKIGATINWVGTDFTQKTLKKLQETFPQFSFVKTGIVPLPFADATFDTVCLLEVLEHIRPSQTISVLKELYRVTKHAGTVIISVPVNEGLEQMIPDNPNSHVRVYSKELLSFELKVSGFKIKQIFSLTAFNSLYSIKKLINSILKLREPNNLIFVLEKS
ncbi:class I SAM-dependent methyltransferase [Candidatus Woesebacteria bacterium]|nr:class I SAM-dependent methyltransferase [Candidatus Woesebacteria bacterium]